MDVSSWDELYSSDSWKDSENYYEISRTDTSRVWDRARHASQGPVCKQVGNLAKKLHATLIRGEACNNYDTVMQNLSLTAKHTVYVGMYICALNSVVTYLYLFCVVYVLQIFVGVLALA